MTITRRRFLSLAALPASIAFSPGSWAVSKGIATDGFIPVGGIEQWVAIRGRDQSRTAILFLHGGPCEAQSPFLPLFAPWEGRYVVAQWDQRGTGRTYGKNGESTPNMTMDRLIQDTVEVARYVLHRLKAKKLILVGHSWGAELGLSVVRARPEYFHACVGTGQPIIGRDIFENLRSIAVEAADKAGDTQAVAELKALTASDFSGSKISTFFKWNRAPFAKPDIDFIIKRQELLGSPKAPANRAASDFFASNPWPGDPAEHPVCLQKLMPFAFEFDARSAGYDVPVPFFVIQGREDIRCPPEAARAFVEKVRAPAKNFTTIDGGHFACFSNPIEFLNALDADIRGLGSLA